MNSARLGRPTKAFDDDVKAALEAWTIALSCVESTQKGLERRMLHALAALCFFENGRGASVDAVAHQIGDVLKAKGGFK